MKSAKLAMLAIKLKKHSPEILLAAGCVGTAVSGYLACRAVLKAQDVKASFDASMECIHSAAELNPEQYSEEDQKKDTTIVYTNTAVEYVKLFAPSVIVYGLSIGMIIAGHNITRKRLAEVGAAYIALNTSYKEYRKRVANKIGEEAERDLFFNVKAETIKNADGTKEKIKVVDTNEPFFGSPYARFYDDGCNEWTKDPESNLCFLRLQNDVMNERIQARAKTSKNGVGYLFLNEVYDALGIPRTKAGQVVGWTYYLDGNNLNGGDNFIDFGIYDNTRQAVVDFVNGYIPTILLDFNVDGPIDQYL